MAQDIEQIKKKILKNFIKELEAFQDGGYEFPSGKAGLFPGTQQEAFDGYVEGLKGNHLHGNFEIPTGVGKTVLFIAIIYCYLKAIEKIPEAPRVLILAPFNGLVIQAAKAFAEFLPELVKTIQTDDGLGHEIDWKNGDTLGVHYGPIKHAEKSPKVLISNYQSETADRRKEDESKRVLKPEDHYLVIYDEAHYITADKFGQAVEKYKDSIQLGVTATPEYSENKTVEMKLPYQYYKITMKEAMDPKRGDLCPACPIVIKVKNNLDHAKAEEFFEKQAGRPLSQKQLEQLMNQKERNIALLETYLRESHPYIGERFLGQTGLIFATGIAHCEDVVRQAKALLEKRQYKAIKRWLEEEGIELIASIHGKTPKGGVPLNIDGEKKLYTSDQIEDLHHRGKVLLLVSDQKLKAGKDYPKDSFIGDLGDRYTKPEAIQRMGRGVRKHRPRPKYDDPGNPDKETALCNVINKNTHELYQGTPHYPIHAYEVLEGAVHRPKMKRKGLTRFIPEPQGKTDIEFEVITDIEVIRNISEGLKDGSSKKDKPENVLSTVEFARLTSRTHSTERKFFKSLKARFDDDPKLKEIIAFGHRIKRGSIVKIVVNGSSPTLGIDKKCVGDGDKDIYRLAEEIKKTKKQDNVLSNVDFAGLTGRGSKTERKFFESVKERFDADPKLKEIEEFDHKIKRGAIVELRVSGKHTLGIDKEYVGDGDKDIYKLAKAIKKTLKPDNVLSAYHFAELTGRDGSTEKRFFKSVKERFDADPELKEIEEFDRKIKRGAIVEFYVTDKLTIGIYKNLVDSVEKLAKAIKKTLKPDNILSVYNFAELTGRYPRTEIKFFQSLKEKFDRNADLKEIE